MTYRPVLLSIGTAVPPNNLDQRQAAEIAYAVFGDKLGGFRQLARVFANAGVKHRHAVMPINWYLSPHGWRDRTAAYLQGAGDLFVDAAREALDKAGIPPAEVDAVVTVSSTGIAAPSLEARLADRLGLRPDVLRVPVFGVGCAGGVIGLDLAARLAGAEPGSTVLFVAVETCTLAFRLDRNDKADVVSTALFGDGAAACVIRASDDRGLAAIGRGAEHTWPHTLDIMGWSVDAEGLGVVLAREIPPFVATQLAPAVAGMLERLHIQPEQVGRYICHPGGGKVIPALEQALHLNQGSLDHERMVLSEHGNMSAPTILFVLQRAIAEGLPQLSLLLAMGPGFTAASIPIERRA